MVASNITAALKNEPIIVFGDGEQSSDFVYIDDIVEGCLRAPRDSAIGRFVIWGQG